MQVLLRGGKEGGGATAPSSGNISPLSGPLAPVSENSWRHPWFSCTREVKDIQGGVLYKHILVAVIHYGL